jgi:hypothetical protein
VTDEPYDESSDEGIDAATEAQVQALLRGNGPQPMPADVWLRLERALMHESARRESGSALDLDEVLPVKRRSSRRRTAAIFGLAAAAALVVGGTVVSTLDLRGGGQGPAPMAAEALGAGSGIVLASGTDYEPTTLAEQVKRTFSSWKSKLRTQPQATTAPDSMMGMGMPDMPFMREKTGFQGCMHKITQVTAPRDIAVLLIDIATLQGDITAIVVVPAGEIPQNMGVDPAMDQVFVVTPTCSVKAHAEVDLDAS